jgi:hypothetical protein
MRKKLTDFECAERDIPACSAGCIHGSEKTVADLVFTIETEIDRRHLKPLLRWLKKWGPQSDYLSKETV